MGPQKREAILVILHLLNRNVPTLNRVALRAIRAHFSLVDVGVTVLAILADVGKNRLDVALGALCFFVHAAQRVLRFVVIELHDAANRPPSSRGVTVFAWNIQGSAVRTSGSFSLRVAAWSGSRVRESKSEPANNLHEHGVHDYPFVLSTFRVEAGSQELVVSLCYPLGLKQLYVRPVLVPLPSLS